ncbi:hypothetical protein C8Q76DRAFT_798828 [Earliella scabrosa]|nr:hypothetical protein C8Q76DRAFT_798828 [Earliella scabrosa]
MPDGVIDNTATFANESDADSVPELEPSTATTDLTNTGEVSTSGVREPWPDVNHVEQFLMVAIGGHRIFFRVLIIYERRARGELLPTVFVRYDRELSDGPIDGITHQTWSFLSHEMEEQLRDRFQEALAGLRGLGDNSPVDMDAAARGERDIALLRAAITTLIPPLPPGASLSSPSPPPISADVRLAPARGSPLDLAAPFPLSRRARRSLPPRSRRSRPMSASHQLAALRSTSPPPSHSRAGRVAPFPLAVADLGRCPPRTSSRLSARPRRPLPTLAPGASLPSPSQSPISADVRLAPARGSPLDRRPSRERDAQTTGSHSPSRPPVERGVLVSSPLPVSVDARLATDRN